MTKVAKPRRSSPDDPHPFADTRARYLLDQAIKLRSREDGTSLRRIAADLDMSSAQLSHMANGRMGIPVDSAGDLAEALGINPAEMVAAVLRQRHPAAAQRLNLAAAVAGDNETLQRMEFVLGGPLSNLEAEHEEVIQEVAQTRSPRSRWATPAEAPFLALLRQAKSKGLSQSDYQKLERAIRDL